MDRVRNDLDLIDRLQEAREQRSDLARTLDLHIELVAARAEAAPSVAPGWTERARLRVERGEPALTLGDIEAAADAVMRLARTVSVVVARHEPELGDALAAVLARLDDPDGDGAARVNPSVFSFVVTQALYPVLRAHAEAARPLLEDLDWGRGACPVCGGAPDFAALTDRGGGRRLLCSRCDTEWQYRRIGCPFCASDTPGSLGYYPVGDGAYRLYVCDQCKGYLKTVDLRERWSGTCLPLERILTAGLDLAARERGYGGQAHATSHGIG